ncbi:MAG TPA: YigZ family protein [Gemmatimonadaceae bacterium]
MANDARYLVPAAQHRIEHTIDRSRFICTLTRIESPEMAQSFIRAMNSEFADATHNCWAYVAGPPGSTSRVGMSDAGEPHGTAGRPMLTVLLHSDVGEIAAVVTRYYGGIKLGTGGLVKAYGGAVQLALETLSTTERVDYVDAQLTIGYANITVIQQLFAAHDVIVDDEAYAADVRYRLRVPRPSVPTLQRALADATRGESVLEIETA